MYRFILAESANPRGYVVAGANAGADALGIQQALDKSTPDYAGLNTVGRELAARKRVSDSKADLDKDLAKMGANEFNAARSLNEQQIQANNTKRFAGKLAYAGMLARELNRKEIKDPPPEPLDYSGFEEVIGNMQDQYKDFIDKINELKAPTPIPNLVLPESLNGIPSSNKDVLLNPSSPASSIPTRDELLPAMSPQQVYSTFIRAGASPSVANRFAYQIVPAESGGIPNNNTITSGLVNRAGETSYGIAQINMFDTQDPVEKARRLKLFGIKNSTDLFDPDVNARAALKLLAEQGWGAWSTYDPSVTY